MLFEICMNFLNIEFFLNVVNISCFLSVSCYFQHLRNKFGVKKNSGGGVKIFLLEKHFFLISFRNFLFVEILKSTPSLTG